MNNEAVDKINIINAMSFIDKPVPMIINIKKSHCKNHAGICDYIINPENGSRRRIYHTVCNFMVQDPEIYCVKRPSVRYTALTMPSSQKIGIW